MFSRAKFVESGKGLPASGKTTGSSPSGNPVASWPLMAFLNAFKNPSAFCPFNEFSPENSSLYSSGASPELRLASAENDTPNPKNEKSIYLPHD